MNSGLFGIGRGLFQDLLLWLVPIGAGMDWWGPESTVPKGYLLPVGQTLNASDYPRLARAWNITTPTFVMPDKRGRASIAKDDMGGTAANRVTSGISGVAGNTLYAAGGDERLQTHLHGVTDPGHTHDYTAPNGGAAFFNLSAGPGPANSAGINNTSTSNASNVTIQNTGLGGSQNVPPVVVCNYIIRAG